MWVFVYGSLMLEKWENDFNGTRHDKARLDNYQRSFNKKSTKNWGTSKRPSPTLGLENKEGTHCIGCAFEFPDDQKDKVLHYLKNREGPSFSFKKLTIKLENGKTEDAFTPVNDLSSNTYIGSLKIEKRVEMVKYAEKGSKGKGLDYVAKIHNELLQLDINDTNVSSFYNAIYTPDPKRKWKRKKYDESKLHKPHVPEDFELETDRDLDKPLEQLVCDVHEETNNADRSHLENIAHAQKRMASMMARITKSNELLTKWIFWLTVAIALMTLIMLFRN